ncbi:MAG TPA: glycoside hydrolase family 88 protein [Terracidiphilus sp.]|jgi:rhamnogalacturonyl hydrolase YesR
MKRQLVSLAAVALISSANCVALSGQTTPVPTAPFNAAAERQAAGDQPDEPGPLATDLSPKIRRGAILKAVKRVADWQLKQAETHYNIDWTYAALYDGMLAASKVTGDGRYHDRVLEVARQNKWGFGPRFAHADDEAIGLTYLAFYAEQKEAERLTPTHEGMDKLLGRPDDADTNLWWWCDALYMAPPVLAQLSIATGDHRYIDFMNHEWWLTSGALYDPAEHLYFRDKRFLTQHEANGQKVFWSRGNGWVLAGLALVLQRMPEHYPDRAKYVAQYKEMAERIARLQQGDGLWRASLLDPASYPNPEISGSAFYTYAMAWGIRNGILDRQEYLPIVSKAWAGMLTHVYADGRLGSIQPIGGEPGKFKPSSSWVYGVGAFLMAGSELAEMAGK